MLDLVVHCGGCEGIIEWQSSTAVLGVFSCNSGNGKTLLRSFSHYFCFA